MEEAKRKQRSLEERLLEVMRKVELIRCLHQPVQRDEQRAMGQLTDLSRHVNGVSLRLSVLQNRVVQQQQQSTTSAPVRVEGVPDSAQLVPILKEQREKLESLTAVVKTGQRDANLVGRRMEALVGGGGGVR